jgi:hypothetical protein
MMKCEADEPVSGSATRCSTPRPSTPLAAASPMSPELASQTVPSPEETRSSSRMSGSAPLLTIALANKASRSAPSSLPRFKSNTQSKRAAAGKLPLKRRAAVPNALGFSPDDTLSLIHDFKRDSFDAMCLEHHDQLSSSSQRMTILPEGEGADGPRPTKQRSTPRISILDRSIMSAALAKCSVAASRSRAAQAALASSASASANAVAIDRDFKSSEWKDKEKVDVKHITQPAVPSGTAPTPSSTDFMSSLQPSLSLHLYPGGFSIDGRPSAHVYEAAHIPLLRSISAGKLPVGCLLDVPNTEHLQFQNGCLLAEVKDHRIPVAKQQQSAYSTLTRRVLLQSDHLNTIADVEHMRRVCGGELSAADALKVEHDIMMRLQGAVCLDPSPNVSLVSNYSQFIRNAARGCNPRPPLASYRFQRIPSEEEQRVLMSSCKFEQDKSDNSRRTPKKASRSSTADASDAADSLPEAAKSGLKLTASMFTPTPMVTAHGCTKPAIRRLRFSRRSPTGREMAATIWVEMRRPSVYEGVVRVEEWCVSAQGVKDVQKPSCAQYQIGNALQVSPEFLGIAPVALDACFCAFFDGEAGKRLGQHHAGSVRTRRLGSCGRFPHGEGSAAALSRRRLHTLVCVKYCCPPAYHAPGTSSNVFKYNAFIIKSHTVQAISQIPTMAVT